MLDKTEKYVTLVFVLSRHEFGLLINKGKEIADITKTKLNVINVRQKSEWGKRFSRELDGMLMISNNMEAQMLVFFSDNPIKILNDYIEKNKVKYIILETDGLKAIDSYEKTYLKSQKIEIYLFDNNKERIEQHEY